MYIKSFGQNMDAAWKWFMAVDSSGSWLTIKGDASITSDGDGVISGSLFLGERFDDSTQIYAQLSGGVEDDGSVCLTVRSSEEGVPSFDVSGVTFETEGDHAFARTFVLTDGTTVLGLTRHAKHRPLI